MVFLSNFPAGSTSPTVKVGLIRGWTVGVMIHNNMFFNHLRHFFRMHFNEPEESVGNEKQGKSESEIFILKVRKNLSKKERGTQPYINNGHKVAEENHESWQLIPVHWPASTWLMWIKISLYILFFDWRRGRQVLTVESRSIHPGLLVLLILRVPIPPFSNTIANVYFFSGFYYLTDNT